jgi:hypothetical protein
MSMMVVVIVNHGDLDTFQKVFDGTLRPTANRNNAAS